MKIILETERLYLREFDKSDYSGLAGLLRDIEVMYAWEHAFTDQKIENWYNTQIERYHAYGYGYWAVIEKTKNAFIGQCGLIPGKISRRECIEIGYIFIKKYWGRGFAAEAAAACKRYAFEQLKAEKIYASVRTNNRPSQKVAEKTGMTIEGDMVIHYNHKAMPHYIYSVVNTGSVKC